MNRKNIRTLMKLLLTCICTLSIICPVWADGPGDGLTADNSQSETSRVITVGAVTDTDDPEAEVVQETKTKTEALAGVTGIKGDSLGMFATTGYCNCAKCSGGFHLTYSGTVPKASHTISADLDIFPIGTRLMINDVIYTVEDMGSGVNDYCLDIYYDSHDEAAAHGMKTIEVFSVVD
ncbi:MAG: 3D domain-containing protein [Lachnospiraceae bacterium]